MIIYDKIVVFNKFSMVFHRFSIRIGFGLPFFAGMLPSVRRIAGVRVADVPGLTSINRWIH